MKVDLVLKLLRLTGSANDHEALNALRKLQEHVGNWNEFIDRIEIGEKKKPRFARRQDHFAESDLFGNWTFEQKNTETEIQKLKEYLRQREEREREQAMNWRGYRCESWGWGKK